MAKCVDCGKDTLKSQACEYCGQVYCEEHWPLHMAWERRHEGLSEDMSRLWKHEHSIEEHAPPA